MCSRVHVIAARVQLKPRTSINSINQWSQVSYHLPSRALRPATSAHPLLLFYWKQSEHEDVDYPSLLMSSLDAKSVGLR
jgi:hypothetical protein